MEELSDDVPTTRTRSKENLALLARAAVGGLITLERAATALGSTRAQAATRLRRLVEQGWLARAQRGVYFVRPLEALEASGSATDDPWVIASQLFAPCYVGGWSAAEHWQLTEQLFRSTFVVSGAPRRRREEVVLSAEFRVARVPPSRIESVAETWRGPVRVRVSDRERTLADGLMHPPWLGGVRHIAEMLVTYRESKSFRPLDVLRHLELLEAGAGIKRLGFLAEQLWPDEHELIARAHEKISKGVVRLDPAVAERGPIHSRWGLSVNVDVEASG